jgi:glycosyltransferase involved in cell wall biosynthesis
VPSGDCAGFTNAMRTLLNNAGLRASMASAARARATAKFNADRMAEGYARLYRNALKACGREVSVAA